MNYDEEASYIESINVSNPGACYCNDPYLFIKYCNMQHKGAVKAKQFNAADRIAVVVETAFDAFHKAKRGLQS